MDIQWYPGHMTRAKRMLTESLSVVDVVIEICDARIPKSSRNPDFEQLLSQKPRVLVLNKQDLADPAQTKRWLACFRQAGYEALSFDATKRQGIAAVQQAVSRAAQQKVQAAAKKGVKKTVRAAVVGIPNVGKSTFINCLAGAAKTNVEDRPGVTRGRQWVRLGDYLEIMDTPGLLWPKLDDAAGALRLAFTGAIRDQILDQNELAQRLIITLLEHYPQRVEQRYGVLDGQQDLLEQICRRRGFLMPGGVLDIDRAAQAVLDEFRAGRLGAVTLDEVSDA